MKLALLGTGMIVTEVLPVLTTIEDIELKAIMSTPQSLDKAETLAKQYGLTQATSDYEAILSNPDVDTIYVGTPNHTHYDYAKQALLAGKHVICERPFTLHLEEFEELSTFVYSRSVQPRAQDRHGAYAGASRTVRGTASLSDCSAAAAA